VGALFGDRGLLHLIDQRHRAEALAHEIEDLQAENARLATEIAALRSDPRAIERLAREELGLARPGETVFLVREPGPATP
jgi:cell division protein FtsB